jgi:hypothetical protein
LPILPSKYDQSVDVNNPFDDADADAMSIVIVPDDVTGVDPIVIPDVVELNPIDVTVPTDHDRSAVKSYAVPLIVKVLDVGTAPISVVVIVDHVGVPPSKPVPVIDKNFFVVVMFGDTINGAPAPLEYIISPNTENGFGM